MGLKEGIVIAAPDATIEARAKALRLSVTVSSDWTHSYERALILEAGAGVRWDLIEAGFHLVRTWDLAVPLSLTDAPDAQGRRPVLACEIGLPEERTRTAQIVHDLRMPVYASEMVFVRRQGSDGREIGIEFVETWFNERARGGNARLAFLRAFYLVKPKLCALPSIWTGEVRRKPVGRRRSARGSRLVSVQVGKGRFVRCYPGREEEVREMYARKKRRGGKA